MRQLGVRRTVILAQDNLNAKKGGSNYAEYSCGLVEAIFIHLRTNRITCD